LTGKIKYINNKTINFIKKSQEKQPIVSLENELPVNLVDIIKMYKCGSTTKTTNEYFKDPVKQPRKVVFYFLLSVVFVFT
jgi:DNA polymerase/3'-5' exonuclease PolX